jgi:hypothetical protein
VISCLPSLQLLVWVLQPISSILAWLMSEFTSVLSVLRQLAAFFYSFVASTEFKQADGTSCLAAEFAVGQSVAS